jgi:hypothetical protein
VPPVSYIGGVSVGAAIPSLLSAQVSLDAELSAKLGELQARAEAVIQIAAGLTVTPISIEASITALTAALAGLQAALTNPAASANFTVIADMTAEIALLIDEVEAGLAASASLGALCATAGLHMYLLEGDIGQMGNDLQSELAGGMPGGSGPAQEGVAIVLLAGSPVSIAALRTVFGQ